MRNNSEERWGYYNHYSNKYVHICTLTLIVGSCTAASPASPSTVVVAPLRVELRVARVGAVAVASSAALFR